MAKAIENRYEFVLFFDVENGNPNGDPDAGNLPRTDPETGVGIISDVCLKRKVRNYIDLVKAQDVGDEIATEDVLGYKIYVQEGVILNERNLLAYKACGMKEPPAKKTKNEKSKEPSLTQEEKQRLASWMCHNFFDIRAFGAVMTTGVNCGQVRGPIQMCFAQSVEPVMPQDMSITRMAVTKVEDAEKERTMGRKQYVPYGLYRAEGFISASLAEKTGFSNDDLNLFFEALMNMFEDDRSAARGLMTSRKLIVFKHESKIGNAPARQLFDSVKVQRVTEGPARHYSDYAITIDADGIPNEVEAQVYDWIKPCV